ncbi:MAG: histidine kinase [Sphingobacteriaceae bacterium]|nr:histidine kinase [Sphingobacteriaceae bacterium]
MVLIFSTIFTAFFFVQLLFEYSINLLSSDIIGATLVFVYCILVGLIHVYYDKVFKYYSSKKLLHYIVKFILTGILAFALTIVFEFLKNTLSHTDADESITKIIVARGLMLNLCFYFIIALMEAIGSMRQYEVEISELRRANQEAQLNQLKNQISPHFFFNSLNTLKSMIEENDKDAVKQPITVILATHEINNTLMISNTIIVKSKVEESNKIGLNNIKSRYNLLGLDGFRHYSKNNLFNVELPLIQ